MRTIVLVMDATKKLPGEGFKRPWPPRIKMDEASERKLTRLFPEKASITRVKINHQENYVAHR